MDYSSVQVKRAEVPHFGFEAVPEINRRRRIMGRQAVAHLLKAKTKICNAAL
jgi:hypothetical protein